MWHTLPVEILSTICQYLSPRDILNCAETCRQWYQSTQDDILWKHALQRDFEIKKPKLKMSPIATSWKDEYIRLSDRVPKVNVQTCQGHIDEVLHITFSHDGYELVSCSKDADFVVWRWTQNGTCYEHFRSVPGSRPHCYCLDRRAQ